MVAGSMTMTINELKDRLEERPDSLCVARLVTQLVSTVE